MPGPDEILPGTAGGRLGTDPLYGTPQADPAFYYWVLHGGDPPPVYDPAPPGTEPVAPPPAPLVPVPPPSPGDVVRDPPSLPRARELPGDIMPWPPEPQGWQYGLDEPWPEEPDWFIRGMPSPSLRPGKSRRRSLIENLLRERQYERYRNDDLGSDYEDWLNEELERARALPEGWTAMNIVDPAVQRRAPGAFGGPPPVFPDTDPRAYPEPRRSQTPPRPSVDDLRRGAAERDRIIRDAAEAARRDSAIRSGAAVVLEGIARAVVRSLPIPVFRVVRGVMEPSTVDPGTVSIEERVRRATLPPEPPEISIRQPPPLPLPQPPTPEITPPWPQPTSTSTPAPAPTSTPTPAPSRVPTPSPTPAPVSMSPPWSALAGLWTSITRRRSPSSSLTRQPFVDPLTQIFSDTPRVNVAPSIRTKFTSGTSPAGAAGSATNPLTWFQPSVLTSSPSSTRTRTRTRTRTDECECKPKKRKKRRDCSVRGNLRWVSGPKKGKPAGSRCVTFKGVRL